MYGFVLILILIGGNDIERIVSIEHSGYPTYALCHKAREAILKDLAHRDDLNGLYADTCSLKI